MWKKTDVNPPYPLLDLGGIPSIVQCTHSGGPIYTIPRGQGVSWNINAEMKLCFLRGSYVTNPGPECISGNMLVVAPVVPTPNAG